MKWSERVQTTIEITKQLVRCLLPTVVGHSAWLLDSVWRTTGLHLRELISDHQGGSPALSSVHWHASPTPRTGLALIAATSKPPRGQDERRKLGPTCNLRATGSR